MRQSVFQTRSLNDAVTTSNDSSNDDNPHSFNCWILTIRALS